MVDEAGQPRIPSQHSEGLAAYWAEALGGLSTYSDAYGDETSVVRIHNGDGPHEETDRPAIAGFDQALEDVGRVRPNPSGRCCNDYFARATMTTMTRYQESGDDVPDPALVMGRPATLSLANLAGSFRWLVIPE